MDQFGILLSQGTANAWWFLPTALGIGALHGLEPGHSKSLMAAFIIAVRGTWQQALVLGLCVAVSHSLIVWCIAALGLYYGPEAQALLSEGRLRQISGVLVILAASWMLWNLARRQLGFDIHHRHCQHPNQQGQASHEDSHLASGEDSHRHDGKHHQACGEDSHITCGEDSHRHDGKHHQASGEDSHITYGEDSHRHDGKHHQDHESIGHLKVVHSRSKDTLEPLSAHDRAHAVDIARRFGSGQASWGQIMLFGLSGGLIPCPASVAVLALCLQAQQVAIGFALVAAFSLGLALTLMLSGLAASLSYKYAHKRYHWIQSSGAYAPWLSASVLLFLGGFLLFGH